MPKILEVCVDTYESAMSAIAGGAHRLELCSSLSENGLTPTPGLLHQIQLSNPHKVPVFCMLRCRPSHFVYTEEEIQIMVQDAKVLKQHGADGFVFGALQENGDIDMRKCREIVKTCFPLPVTFHRAFDVCRNPGINLETVIDLGFDRVLTSGSKKSALQGCRLIKELINKYGDRISIMPGGGINKDNLKTIMDETGANEYHCSARIKMNDVVVNGISFNGSDGFFVTDKHTVGELVHILKEV